MKTRLTLIFFALCFYSGFAQLKLADKFFNNFSYKKAIELYKNEVTKGNNSLHVLTKLGDAYYNNSKTEESAQWYGLALDKYEEEIEPEYIYKQIQSLVSIKEFKKAQKWAKKLKKIQKDDPSMRKFIPDDFEAAQELEEIDERLKITINNLNLNTNYSDFGAYVKDDVFYFASSRDTLSEIYDWNKEPFLDLYQAEITKSNKTINIDNSKKIASQKINTNYHEASIAITNDGNTIYFTRDNVTSSNRLEYSKDGTTNLKIFKGTLDPVTKQWTKLKELPFNNDMFSTGHPALSPDNKRLYFASDREGGYGKSDLYVVNINDDGTYSAPRNLGPKINTKGRELFPFISKDNILYYSSDGTINFGLLDIYESNILNDEEAESVNLKEPFNSGFDDFAYIFDSETKDGYLSSNREGGKGSDDIYGFNIYLCQQNIEGIVRDERTDDPLPDVIVQLIDDTGKIIEEQTTNSLGEYKFENQLCEKTYTVMGSKPDFKEDYKQVVTSYENEKVNIVDLYLVPLIINNQIVINPIFFDFDKSNIRTDAQFELENIVDVMREHPTMVIKIESHTDSRGSDRYNMSLSDRRAKSTRDYIISRGVDPSRIESAIGFGESQLLNECANGIKCSDEDHQRNRRSYFYIVQE